MNKHEPIKNMYLQAHFPAASIALTHQFITVLFTLLLLFSGCITEKPSIQLSENKKKAPEIISTGRNGETLKLSDSKGKLVLIEFWSSSSSESRKNHFEMQRLHNIFQNKEFKIGEGFTVFSVSLDTDKEKWLQAIATDQNTWENQANDLKGWYSQAAISYSVNTLPKYFLVDGDGNIADKYVNISDLETLLRKQLK